MGRFLNEDTVEGQIDNPLSQNLYTYVINNPLIYTDPTGHEFNVGTGGGGGAMPAPSGVSDPAAMDALFKALFVTAAGIFTGTKVTTDTTTSTKNNNKNMVTLYHGTSASAAANILKNGIDVTYGRDDLDFGQGFYVTTDPNQAEKWAYDNFGDAGLVMKFTVDAREFAQFKGLIFKSASGKWECYVTLGRQNN